MTATRNVPAYYSDLGRLRMLGGHPALDLANTIHWRDGKVIDFVPDFAALVNWAVPAKLLTPHEAQILHEQTKVYPDEGTDVVSRWLRLRGLFRSHLAQMTAEQDKDVHDADEPIGFGELGRESTRLLGTSGLSGLEGEFAGSVTIATDLPLLRSVNAVMNLLLFTPQRQIRACEGDPCGGFFIDSSRSRPRRWCAMDACGNRAKVHRHRELSAHLNVGSGGSR